MSHPEPVVVTSQDGMRGTIVRPAELSREGTPEILVHFESGRELFVQTDLLLQQEDGSYVLPITVDEIERRNAERASRSAARSAGGNTDRATHGEPPLHLPDDPSGRV